LKICALEREEEENPAGIWSAHDPLDIMPSLNESPVSTKMGCQRAISLTELPAELLLIISEYLDHLIEINSMSLTCHWLHALLNHRLYRYLLAQYPSMGTVLKWAAESGREECVRRILDLFILILSTKLALFAHLQTPAQSIIINSQFSHKHCQTSAEVN
jgi:hypothetical protein